jgi:hypothetical protein
MNQFIDEDALMFLCILEMIILYFLVTVTHP